MTDISERVAALTVEQRDLFRRQLERGKPGSLQKITRQPNLASYPLSYAQQRVWFLNQLISEAPVYNCPIAIRLSGKLEQIALEGSLNEICRRHEVLRTVFANNNGEARQIILPFHPITLPVLDLSSLPLETREREADKIALAEPCYRFDLVSGPLHRFILLKLDDNEHILIRTMHQIITDGWSNGVFLKELVSLYSAFTNGKKSPLAELPIQYTDFAQWQRVWLQGEVLENELKYWKEQLAGAPVLLQIPADRPRPASMTFHGEMSYYNISSELSESIKAISRQLGVSLYIFMLAAFKVLLYRLTGEEDIVAGTPNTNRNRIETEPLLGFFVNMLALRTDLTGNPTFRNLVLRVQKVAKGAFTNQNAPFERILEDLLLHRDPSYSPLFQVIFSVQNAPMPGWKIGEVTLTPQQVKHPTSKFDFSLFILDDAEGLNEIIEYSTNLFDSTTIHRIERCYQTLLKSIVKDIDIQIAQLSILTESETNQLLFEWNHTHAKYQNDTCISGLFERQVIKKPDAVAVTAGEEWLSYSELNVRSNQLAHYLRNKGISAEIQVGICMDRGLEMLIGMLGTLKAGGAYLVLDPTYPRERLAYILEDSGARVLIHKQSQEIDWNVRDLEIICIDTDWSEISKLRQSNLSLTVVPTNLAYVVYTSGSTGVPKGVMAVQQNAINRFSWMWQKYPFSDDEVCCWKTPSAFVDSVWEIWGPLLQGVRTVIASDETVKDVSRLVLLLDNHRVTRIVLVPSLLRAILDLNEALDNKLSNMSIWITSGEAIPLDLFHQIERRFPLSTILNLYGSSEVAADATWFDSSEALVKGHVPIGKPISNMKIHILDRNLLPVGIGVPGELFVGGDGLARGYHQNPKLTASKFIPDAYSNSYGAKLYKSGDLGRYSRNGEIEFLGRNDHQIKIRGCRVELGEIESILLTHPGVHQAVVICKKSQLGDGQLLAYLLPAIDPPTTATDLREYLGIKLPEFMIPSAFAWLEALELTPSGKVNRNALSLIDQVHSKRSMSYSAPRTLIEAALVEMWRELLEVERPGVEDDFFELGGHSLLAARLLNKISDKFYVDLPLKTLFERRTIASLSMIIAQHRLQQGDYGKVVDQFPKIIPAPDQWSEPFPLTDMQQAYWIGRNAALEMGDVATHVYLELESPNLDLEKCNQAWQRLIDRHATLRIIISKDGLQQQLESVPPYRIEFYDLRGLDQASFTPQLEAVRYRMSHQMIDINRWPLFDIKASLLDEGRIRIHLSIDGLLFDGWSYQILFREWVEVYQNINTALTPLNLTFRDYVMSEAALIKSESYQKSLDYWRVRLESLPPAPDLPMAVDPATIAQPHFVRQDAKLPTDVWNRLKMRAASLGITPPGLLVAVYAEVLATWSKSLRFTINVPHFNRLPLHPQVNDILGTFASFSLLQVDNTGGHSFAVRARRIQEQLWNDMDHSRVSGVRLMRELARARGRIMGAVMPVVFTSTPRGNSKVEKGFGTALKGLGEIIYSITQTSQVWLDNQVHEADGELIIKWDAVEEVFSPDMLQDMFSAYHNFLLKLADDEVLWLETRKSLLPPVQYQQREAINATEVRLTDDLAHTLFEDQVKQRPDQTAVISSSRRLTYLDLFRRSNQVAHWLRRVHVQPNKLVAIVMEKGEEQIIGVLSVLQAGAAYLPIDPQVPQERLWYLLENGEVEVVLTQPWIDQKLKWPDGISRFCIADDNLINLDDSALVPIQSPDDLAYVIYTSGSTGEPKGVMISHRSLVNLILDSNRSFGITERDRAYAITLLHHDLSAFDIFALLAAGGTIVIPDADFIRDPAHWAEQMRGEEVTVWNSVPAIMEMLIEYLFTRPDMTPVSLRLTILGGDWVPVTLPNRLRALIENIDIITIGGPTETTIWNICYKVGKVDPNWKSIPYGKPMANAKYFVFNEAMEDCPVFVPGQLYCAGVGLAKGYWQNDEWTSKSFLSHPVTGERLYRTGDLGRFLPDGNIEFLGREDFQVKINGHRIELGEIEATLLRHPDIISALVTTLGEPGAQQQLAAYLVMKQAPAEDISNHLSKFLSEKIPNHMIPGYYVILDALPLTSNGKVDRQALPLPVKTTSIYPKSEEESTIIDRVTTLVASVLKLDYIDPNQNLLDLGATSIEMIRIANVLETELKFRPNLKEFFLQSNVKSLAAAFEKHLKEQNTIEAKPHENIQLGIASLIAEFKPILDPDQRDAFKNKQPGLRIDEGKEFIQLASLELSEESKRRYIERRSYRKFENGPIAFEHFSKFLSCLSQIYLDNKPKYLFASPGGLYPVQTYLHLKPQRVEGVGEGTYYYNPEKHRLVTLIANAQLDRNIHVPFINQPIFDEAAFSIFLIVQLSAIAPIYGEHSIHYATIQAGLMAQMMELSANANQIGLCQIGAVNFDDVRHLFDLESSHLLLHSLLGGKIGDYSRISWAPFQEALIDHTFYSEEFEEGEL